MASATSSESSDSWFKPSWKVALGAGAVIAVIGAYLAVRSAKKDNDGKKTKKSKSKKPIKTKTPQAASNEKSSSAPTASPVPVANANVERKTIEMPSDSSLIQLVINAMESLQSRAETEASDQQHLLNILKSLDPNKYSPKTRLLSAQWLILFHTIKSMSAVNQDEYKTCSDQQQKDMQLAWRLLDCNPSKADESQAVDLLRLDVAQRLKDYSKMAPVFDRVMSRGDDMTYEETVVAFTTAPLLGRWASTRVLGERILKNQPSLEDFHRAALQRPDIPDYEVLYQLAEEEAARGDASPESLQWLVFGFQDLQIRLSNVITDDEEKREEMRQNFDPELKGEWKKIPVESSQKLWRFGGIAQMLSLSRIPIPMVGPADDRRMKLLGYATLNLQNGGQLKQTEVYDLTKDPVDESMWEGTYTLIQSQQETSSEDEQPHEISSSNITFQMKMKLARTSD